MKKNSQHNNDRASPLNNSPSDAPAGSGLRGLFQCFLALEAEGKSLNDHKAALFARAKADGYDSKALRAAFRQRAREMQYPEETTKHGELTDSYLLILRSEGMGDPDISYSSSTSLSPAEPAPDALARSHAHTRTRESVSHVTDSAVISLADPKSVRVNSSDMDVSVADDSHITVRCSQVRCLSTADISMQAVETCE
jgi:uncharacterized protein (UPF0335 family)